MSAMDKWENASSPNYETNTDKGYHYSEIPFLDKYKLVKIPFCVKNLIEHVDYLGYGKIQLNNETIIGFSNCYNVNCEFELVHSGLDAGRKIPNRIPISSKYGYSTRNYIKDNSVRTVTVTITYNKVCKIICQDIARIVNSERGKVIVYGFSKTEIETITDELRTTKHLFYCPIYKLPDNLQLTYYNDDYRAYVGINELKRLLYGNVKRGDIEAAVTLTGCLTDIYCGGALADVVYKLLANNIANVIVYAGRLWNNNGKEVVRVHFPPVFQHIFDGDCMDIINYKNNQTLVLKPKTSKARGDGHYKSSNKSGWRWKIIPTWVENKVFFKLYNIDSDTYLQLSASAGEDGDRQATGSKDPEELSEELYFKPLIVKKGQVAFHIFNDEDKRLELPVDLTPEVTAVGGHQSEDEQTLSEDEDLDFFNVHD